MPIARAACIGCPRVSVAWQAVVGVLGAAFVVFTFIACYVCISRRRRNDDDSVAAGRVVTSWSQLGANPVDPDAIEETTRLTSDPDVPLSKLPGVLHPHEDVGRISDPDLHPPIFGPPAYEGRHQV